MHRDAIDIVDFEKKVFDIKDEPMPKRAWWWWFWLFFFDNPNNPERPRQLMILWSTKNVKSIKCNDKELKLAPGKPGSCMPGAVAAWYFDGKKMHHDFLLENCDVMISPGKLSALDTSFSIEGTKNTVKIGKDFEFMAEPLGESEFSMPTYHSRRFVRDMGYTLMRLNRLSLKGTVKGMPVRGTAYFQRVFVTAPATPWYWGIFHFRNGGILTYFNPRFMGKSIRKDIAFFDGREFHQFGDMKVKRTGGKLPEFRVTGKSGEKEIDFTVKAYSHSSWTFRKKSRGLIPNKLVYNEYPATITSMRIKGDSLFTPEELGFSVGNAEHTTGFLF